MSVASVAPRTPSILDFPFFQPWMMFGASREAERPPLSAGPRPSPSPPPEALAARALALAQLRGESLAERIVRRPAGDKVTLACREYGPSDGPKLLCLHGLTANSLSFGDIAKKYASLGYHVIVPDLPGRVMNVDVPGEGCDGHARLLRAMLDGIGAETVHIMGHSMGAFVAVELVAQELAAQELAAAERGGPDRIGKVILIDGGLGPAESGAVAAIMKNVSRFGTVYASADEHLKTIEAKGFLSPVTGAWADNFRGELEPTEGGFKVRINPSAVDRDLFFCGYRCAWEPWMFGKRMAELPRDRTLVLRAGVPMVTRDGNVISSSDLTRLQTVRPDVTIATIEGANHYTIMTAPAAIGAMTAFLG